MDAHESTQATTSIESTLREHIEEVRRAIVHGRILGAVLLAAIALWLGWLHGQITRLDADGMATLVQERARTALPSAAAQLRVRLEQAAPELTELCKQKMLQAPALLRERFEEEAEVWLKVTALRLQQALDEHVHLDLDGMRAQIARRYPGASEQEQLRALVQECAHEYRQQAWTAMTQLAPCSERVIEELTGELERLARGEGLDQDELLQREILATVLELAPRLELSGQPDSAVFHVTGWQDADVF